jgi:hypothetical protein
VSPLVSESNISRFCSQRFVFGPFLAFVPILNSLYTASTFVCFAEIWFKDASRWGNVIRCWNVERRLLNSVLCKEMQTNINILLLTKRLKVNKMVYAELSTLWSWPYFVAVSGLLWWKVVWSFSMQYSIMSLTVVLKTDEFRGQRVIAYISPSQCKIIALIPFMTCSLSSSKINYKLGTCIQTKNKTWQLASIRQ